MNKKNKKALRLITIIWIISLPFIIWGIFSNCVLNFDFSWKCFSENFSAWIWKWFNVFVEYKQEQTEKKLEKLEEKLNNINTWSLSSSWLIR